MRGEVRQGFPGFLVDAGFSGFRIAVTARLGMGYRELSNSRETQVGLFQLRTPLSRSRSCGYFANSSCNPATQAR